MNFQKGDALAFALIHTSMIFLSFAEKVTDDYIYDLLYSAKEAHMNMLRVWGGK